MQDLNSSVPSSRLPDWQEGVCQGDWHSTRMLAFLDARPCLLSEGVLPLSLRLSPWDYSTMTRAWLWASLGGLSLAHTVGEAVLNSDRPLGWA